MDFEFDPMKSISNKRKHGIDFDEAQRLWDDFNLIEIPIITNDGSRFLIVAKLDEKHWSGIITYREGRIRIISIRRSRKDEVALYESS